MARNAKLRPVPVDVEKQQLNEQWDEYLSGLTKDKINRDVLATHMQRMDNMDYRLIELKRRDLLG